MDSGQYVRDLHLQNLYIPRTHWLIKVLSTNK